MVATDSTYGGNASDTGGITKNLDNMLFIEDWELSNYGNNRSDGFSLHINNSFRKMFIKDYWKGMPDKVPGTYSRPEHNPYVGKVSDKLYDIVVKNGGSFRVEGFEEKEFLSQYDVSGLRRYLTADLKYLLKELPPAKDPTEA